MRKLDIGMHGPSTVLAVDEPGAGGACHEYHVTVPCDPTVPEPTFAVIKFQKGGIQDSGINGCHNEDLLAIVIDRLQGFQSGDFCCRENALALTKLEEALHWLNHRTQSRIRRGVEGIHRK